MEVQRHSKKCNKCDKTLPVDMFWRNKQRVNGYSSSCKNCHGVSDRECRRCKKVFTAKPRPYCTPECRRADRPQTFKNCLSCGTSFRADHLSRKFCSYKCKVVAQSTGIKKRWVGTPEARRAQRRVAYAIQKGDMFRPSACEQCGKPARIEAAHYNYSEPLRVRWLCRSCHSKWDKDIPKGGAMRWEAFTGKKAELHGN